MCDVQFKIGDRVRIRDWDDMVAEFGLSDRGSIPCEYVFTQGMRDLCGSEYVITGVVGGRCLLYPRVEWNISADMIEHCDRTKTPPVEVPIVDLFRVLEV